MPNIPNITPSTAAERARRRLSSDVDALVDTLRGGLLALAGEHGADAAIAAADAAFGEPGAEMLREALLDTGWTRDEDADEWIDPDADGSPFLSELRRVQTDSVRAGVERGIAA